MATTTSDGGTIVRPVLVAVLVALLVGSSAPWWWGPLTDGGDDEATSPPSPTPAPDPGGGDDVTTTTGSTEVPDGTCVITIVNPLVTMHEEPDAFGPQVGRVPQGDHVVEDVVVVPFAGSDERWFRITADGRSGWIMDNTIIIDRKSRDCP